jgi:hypothetical protein
MIHKRELLASLLLACISGWSLAQAPPTVIPPSPNATAFSKYGNIPVSTYTGIPTIDIPLYEISSRDIKIPVSISYHASGIRVSEEASRIGLGWVLNCGGVISRNIVGGDDFFSALDGFLFCGSDAPPIPAGPAFVPFTNNDGPNWAQPSIEYKYVATNSGATTTMDLYDYTVPPFPDPNYRPHDFEPDQYTFNFGGRSGRFAMNRPADNDCQTDFNPVVVIEKQEKIQFMPERHGISWEVTTSDGFKYFFRDVESYLGGTGAHQVTAWYLSQIVSPQGESVTFEYEIDTQAHIKPVGSWSERRYETMISQCPGVPGTLPQSQVGKVPGKEYTNLVLKSVTWSNGRLEIVKGSREDVAGDSRITALRISNKDAAGQYVVYEEISFSQDYFVSGSTTQDAFPVDDPVLAQKRLKLTGLTRRSTTDRFTQPETYQFTYYEGDGAEQLAPKNSYRRDHWGFANGGLFGNRMSLLPSYKAVLLPQNYSQILGVMGPEKNSSYVNAVLYTLKSIKYPTKGTTTFFYSLNDYDGTPFSTAPESPTRPEYRNMLCTRGDNVHVDDLDFSDEFVKAGKTLPIEVSASFYLTFPENNWPPEKKKNCSSYGSSVNVYFQVEDLTGNAVYGGRITPDGSHCTTQTQPDCILCDATLDEDNNGFPDHPESISNVLSYKSSLILPPGRYKWRAYIDDSNNDGTVVLIDKISVAYTYQVDAAAHPTPTPTDDGTIGLYSLGGGLRVKRIEDYTAEGQIIVKKYDYHYRVSHTTAQDTSYSYGKLMMPPAYSFFTIQHEQKDMTGCDKCYALTRDAGHPQANYSGTLVGYSKVREIFGDNGEGGYIEYEYENESEEIKTYYSPFDPTLPIEPPSVVNVRNDRNGLLKSKTYYSATGEKIQSTINEYATLDSYGPLKSNNEPQNNFVLYGVVVRKLSDASWLAYESRYITLIYEALRSSFSYMKSSTTTYFKPDGSEGNSSATFFTYGNRQHLQLTDQRTVEKDGNEEEVTYLYPADINDTQATDVIKEMKGSRFMHSLPIQTTVRSGPTSATVVKSSQFTIYENFYGKIFPKEKWSFDTAKIFTTAPLYVPNGRVAKGYKKIYSLDYDVNGNLRKVQKQYDRPTGYLWSYRNTLPVAEIKSGDADAAYVNSFEETGDLFTASSGENRARSGWRVYSSGSFTFPADYAPIESNTLMSYWYWQDATQSWTFSGVVPFQRTFSTSGSKIDEVRAYPQGALVTTFAHLPNIGMSSQTDANNITTYYEYDNLRRLKLIRDNNKSIVKSYEYHYKR